MGEIAESIKRSVGNRSAWVRTFAWRSLSMRSRRHVRQTESNQPTDAHGSAPTHLSRI